jgi:hypothetical protein
MRWYPLAAANTTNTTNTTTNTTNTTNTITTITNTNTLQLERQDEGGQHEPNA